MEDEENMTFMVQLPADFPLDELQQIASMLERADVFVPGYIPPGVGIYHLGSHFYGSMVDNVSLVLLPDRNIVSRLAKATTGGVADDQERLAAAGTGPNPVPSPQDSPPEWLQNPYAGQWACSRAIAWKHPIAPKRSHSC